MRLALCQCPSPAGDVARAFDEIGRALRAAAAAGAQMLVLPELLLPGYNCDRIAELAQPANGEWAARLQRMAADAGCGLAVGFAEREGGRLYNAALVIGARGEVLAHYRKVQLFGPREAALFAPGDRLTTFPLGSRTAAVMICYDVEFAAHVRALALQGADLILVPTANMVPWTYVCDHTVPSQAVTNGVTIAYANLCGTEGELTYCGGSVIAGPDAAVLAKAGMGAALLIVDLPDRVEPARIATHLRDYRPLGTDGAS